MKILGEKDENNQNADGERNKEDDKMLFPIYCLFVDIVILAFNFLFIVDKRLSFLLYFIGAIFILIGFVTFFTNGLFSLMIYAIKDIINEIKEEKQVKSPD